MRNLKSGLLAACVLGALLGPSVPSARAADINSLQFHGSARLRVEGDDRTDFATDRDYSSLRVRPDVTYTPDKTVDLLFEPQYVRVFGEPILTPATTTTNSSVVASGAFVDSSLTVHQGYVDYHPIQDLRLIGGRQILSYGDELIIGATDWNLVGRSFDAFRLRKSWHLGAGSFSDLFASKIVDNNTTSTSTGGDVTFYGLYNSLDVAAWLHAFDVYLLYQRDNSGSPQTNLYVMGGRLKSERHGVDYRVEGTEELGSAVADGTSSFQVDGEVGYTFNQSEVRPRFALEGFTAGRNYNQLYPTTHKWLGFADVLGRRNIQGFVAHASAELVDNLVTYVDYHRFYRYDDNAPAFKLNGVTALGSGTITDAHDIGSEIDLTVEYRATRAVKLAVGGSLFFKGRYLNDNFPQDWVPTFYYAQIELAL